tara:strand:- start:297 stop:491 length:195 start_codon:yes stop_codon:yes gene_type:complete
MKLFVIYFLLNSLIIIQTPSNDDAFCIGYIMPNSHPAIPSKPFLASQPAMKPIVNWVSKTKFNR